jgi:hypothetical protein
MNKLLSTASGAGLGVWHSIYEYGLEAAQTLILGGLGALGAYLTTSAIPKIKKYFESLKQKKKGS